MKNKRFLNSLPSLAGLAVVLLAVGLLVGMAWAADVIKMENKAYEKHTKPIVEFNHKMHAEDYAQKHADFFKKGCGECHHDDAGKPLTNLKADASVQGCIECHSKPGPKPKGEKLSDKEELAYHTEALHANCRGCHKDYNKAEGLKSKDEGYAPTSCTKCHTK
jgi:hypothetical protein